MQAAVFQADSGVPTLSLHVLDGQDKAGLHLDPGRLRQAQQVLGLQEVVVVVVVAVVVMMVVVVVDREAFIPQDNNDLW